MKEVQLQTTLVLWLQYTVGRFTAAVGAWNITDASYSVLWFTAPTAAAIASQDASDATSYAGPTNYTSSCDLTGAPSATNSSLRVYPVQRRW